MLSESACVILPRSNCNAKNMRQAGKQILQSSCVRYSVRIMLCRAWSSYRSNELSLFFRRPGGSWIKPVSALIFLNWLVKLCSCRIIEDTSLDIVLTIPLNVLLQRPGAGCCHRRRLHAYETYVFSSKFPPGLFWISGSSIMEALVSFLDLNRIRTFRVRCRHLVWCSLRIKIESPA